MTSRPPKLVLFLLAVTLAAQTTAPAFEVATVKPAESRPMKPAGLFTYPGGRINVSLMTLQALIKVAYGLEDYQVSGGPSWTANDGWDIVAQPPASSESSKFNPTTIKTPPTPELLKMLQTLLEERFQLTFRKETKEVSGYALLVDKGAKLNPPKDPEEFRVVAYGRTGKADRPDYLEGHNASMDRLASRLGDMLHRPVLNQTGIKGDFDFRFEYAGSLSDTGGLSIFTALQEDLGLKLVATKTPIQMWIIDSAARPTGN